MTAIHPQPHDPSQSDYLSALLKLSQTLNSSLELRQVLDTAMSQVVAFVGAERGFIMLVDPETGRVWGEALHNIERQALEATLSGKDGYIRAEISRSLVERVLDNRESILSTNAMEDPRFAGQQSVQLSHLRAVMGVPLIAQKRTLGVIYLDSRVQSNLFTERHVAMLEAFAAQAAIAIENARLYDDLRRSMDERLRLQDELHRQETRRLALEEAGRLKSEFVGFVAHELRNPLTAVQGFAQTLLQDTDETLTREERREFCEAIEDDSARLLDMIDEMLDIARLESGRPLTLNLKSVHLRSLLERLVKRHRFSRYFTASHVLVLNADPALPEHVTADESKLSQVITNLLTNATKYSPNGGQILISAGPLPAGGYTISCSDTGVGMSPDQVVQLFRKYERMERSTIKNIPGTGLGLFLAKHLVDLHGGTITCRSVEGAGSTFTLTLPSAPPEEAGAV